MVTRLDRLARSTIDLLTTIKQLADNWADGDSRRKVVLTVIGGLAEFERELIKARTAEGRERAKRARIKMGRKPLLSPHQIAEIPGKSKLREYLFDF